MSRHTSQNDNNVKHGGLRGILCFIAIIAVAMLGVPTHGQVGDENPDAVVPTIPGADRYATGRIFLERADKLMKPAPNVEYQVLSGNVLFRRGDMYMYCDSAHFYDATNSLQAFGNVKMEQGDTLFVYADELEYTDSTELAVLYADPGKKVRLINRDVELQTDVFNYDMGIELGYYEVGGELIDKQNRLTSIYGEYAPNTKDAIFRNRVHLSSLSENDTLNIYTEALHYNTDNHIAELTDISTIVSKDGTIYTDSGSYNTETSIADLYARSLVVTKTGKTLTGDTLFYDRNAGYGEAWGNMILNDTVNKSKLMGDYGFYNELTDSAFVTGHAMAVDYSSADSLSLHGDTIKAFKVIIRTEVPKKNLVRPDVEVPAEESPDNVADTLVVNDIDVGAGIFEEAPVAEESIVEPVGADADLVSVDSVALQVDSVALSIDNVIQSVDTVCATVDSLLVSIGSESLPVDSVTVPVDTLITSVVPDIVPSGPKLPPVKEVDVVCDTTHHIVAYPNVRFFRTDLQGVCDSMTFVQRDSLLYMDIDPIVWSGDRQIFGETIMVHMNDSTADRVTLPNNAFMAELLEPGYFNQMSGREMVAYLADRTLKHLDVNGNVTLVFFPMEEDSTYNKVANAESSFLAADFNKGQIERLKMWPQSTEVITPLYLAKKSLFFLNGFRWDIDRRPKGHDDLMPSRYPDEDQSEDFDDMTDMERLPGDTGAASSVISDPPVEPEEEPKITHEYD